MKKKVLSILILGVLISTLLGLTVYAKEEKRGTYGTLPPISVQKRMEQGTYSRANARTAAGQWIQDASTGRWWYSHDDGSYTMDDWEKIGDRWYHFDSAGWMETGWFTDVDGKQYYLHDTEGYMMVKWVLSNGEWYYMDEHGVMVTGWRTIDGVKYYFALDGRMIIEQESKKTLSLKVYPDSYFNTDYGMEYANTISNKIQTPFTYVWNLSISPSVSATTYKFPNLQCLSDSDMYCEDAIDSVCENSTETPYHHRNANKNLAYMKNNIPVSDANLRIALTSTPLCGVWNNNHARNILGVTWNSDSNSYITCLPDDSENVHVRIIQHEMSHMFGAHDASCNPAQECVMKGSFDGFSLAIPDIWCDNCKEDFNRNQY